MWGAALLVFTCKICPFSLLNLHALFTLFLSINITTDEVNFLSFDNDDMKPSKLSSFFHVVNFSFKIYKLVAKRRRD